MCVRNLGCTQNRIKRSFSAAGQTAKSTPKEQWTRACQWTAGHLVPLSTDGWRNLCHRSHKKLQWSLSTATKISTASASFILLHYLLPKVGVGFLICRRILLSLSLLSASLYWQVFQHFLNVILHHIWTIQLAISSRHNERFHFFVVLLIIECAYFCRTVAIVIWKLLFRCRSMALYSTPYENQNTAALAAPLDPIYVWRL